MSGVTASAGRFPAARTAHPRSLRLTQRGRLLLLVLVALALTALLGVTRTAVAWAEPGAEPTRTVVIQSGESLWQIAKRVDSDRDPRAVIAELERLNDLESGAVVAGQALLIPS